MITGSWLESHFGGMANSFNRAGPALKGVGVFRGQGGGPLVLLPLMWVLKCLIC